MELHLKTVGLPFRAMTTHFSSRALEDRRYHPAISYQIRKQKEARFVAYLSCRESDSASLLTLCLFLLFREDVAQFGFVLPHAPFRALDQWRNLA